MTLSLLFFFRDVCVAGSEVDSMRITNIHAAIRILMRWPVLDIQLPVSAILERHDFFFFLSSLSPLPLPRSPPPPRPFSLQLLRLVATWCFLCVCAPDLVFCRKEWEGGVDAQRDAQRVRDQSSSRSTFVDSRQITGSSACRPCLSLRVMSSAGSGWETARRTWSCRLPRDRTTSGGRRRGTCRPRWKPSVQGASS